MRLLSPEQFNKILSFLNNVMKISKWYVELGKSIVGSGSSVCLLSPRQNENSSF